MMTDTELKYKRQLQLNAKQQALVEQFKDIMERMQRANLGIITDTALDDRDQYDFHFYFYRKDKVKGFAFNEGDECYYFDPSDKPEVKYGPLGPNEYYEEEIYTPEKDKMMSVRVPIEYFQYSDEEGLDEDQHFYVQMHLYDEDIEA